MGIEITKLRLRILNLIDDTEKLYSVPKFDPFLINNVLMHLKWLLQTIHEDGTIDIDQLRAVQGWGRVYYDDDRFLALPVNDPVLQLAHQMGEYAKLSHLKHVITTNTDYCLHEESTSMLQIIDDAIEQFSDDGMIDYVTSTSFYTKLKPLFRKYILDYPQEVENIWPDIGRSIYFYT